MSRTCHGQTSGSLPFQALNYTDFTERTTNKREIRVISAQNHNIKSNFHPSSPSPRSPISLFIGFSGETPFLHYRISQPLTHLSHQLYNPPWQSTFCRQSTDYESKDKHCKILKQFCSDTATILAVALQQLCSSAATVVQ